MQAENKRIDSEEMLQYSDHEEESAPHTQEVAQMLSKEARNAFIGWESHGSRIIKLSFKTNKKGITMNVMRCYAPTNDSNDDDKDQLYERLQSITAKFSGNNLTILMGVLNVKFGMDNMEYEDIMRRHGLTERKEREW
ncbi:hypothetical protein MS3_00007302 [Schistosoma haematobium]|uniref:Uncharacterized protein n=1 Tax=Schistosoma haematobium TaxID=6185 RepID=A0A922LFP5_SCHHA|nr:hypothetical protein MS3_00007302 [Schistosoma haematobium]KAH9582601.1 hypothetical protein MS3_00007302 [Schistosoma haematobium]